jgi:hypothetical protein
MVSAQHSALLVDRDGVLTPMTDALIRADMTGKEDAFRASAIRALCRITDVCTLTSQPGAYGHNEHVARATGAKLRIVFVTSVPACAFHGDPSDRAVAEAVDCYDGVMIT